MVLRNALGTAMAMLRLHLLARTTPLSVILSITNRCNFNCSYCHVGARPAKEMTTEQILQLVDEMAAAGTQRIGIQGGEPLLRKDIGEVIDHCKRRGLFVTMGTNGSLLPKKIEEVRNLDALVLSFDGPNAHDRYRQEGSYDQVIEAIKLARRSGIRVWTTTVLTNYSIGDIDLILETAEQHDFSTYFTPLCQVKETTGDTSALFASKDDYVATIDRLMDEKRKGRPVVNSLSYLRFMRDWPDFTHTMYLKDAPVEARRVPCYAGRFFCHINCNGDVYPCIQLRDEGNPKNALEVGFREAFDALLPLPCSACSTFSFMELNLMFSLHLEAILNTLRLAAHR
ncbi:MAG: radical SAM protein [Candidatus Undinarchaeales archaeon]|nr:radical SAM protein [Candidatus Undinarchaeales archaeon]MDP7494136.1 radical SAM protein [Candidatus Undinarchaeales archaeon]